MKRNLKQLTRNPYDLLVIGGGIYGAFIAWDAALRGLTVALVDKGDFGGATSSNNLRIVHGGLRYLQHGDFRRMRESIRERTILMRIAPHLVHPLPFLIPTYGHFMRGKEVMSLALAVNDLIGFDRNSLNDPQKCLPRGRVISKRECLRLIPGLDARGLTGGAIWHDCQMHSSERLVLSVLHSAARAGAEMANYVRVTGFLQESDRVFGVKVEDALSGEKFDIRAALVMNASGPWVDSVLGLLNGLRPSDRVSLSKATNIVVRRRLVSEYAVGVFSKAVRNEGAILRKRSRLLFITPWHHHSLIGTTHESYEGDAENFGLIDEDIEYFIREINEAYPAASLNRDDVTFVHAGLLPVTRNNRGTQGVNLLKQYQILDHLREDGLAGLVSVIGVKYTTARNVAQRAVDLVFEKLRKRSPRSLTAEAPVHGGDIEHFSDFLRDEIQKQSNRMNPETTRHLVCNYGSIYPQVLHYQKKDPGAINRISGQSTVIEAEILHGIREEMAQKLVDVVMRRTELGTFGYPGDPCLRSSAAIMATEMGWSSTRTERELAEAKAIFSSVSRENLRPGLLALDQRQDVAGTLSRR